MKGEAVAAVGEGEVPVVEERGARGDCEGKGKVRG